MNLKFIFPFLLLYVVIIFSSCDNSRVIDDYHILPHSKWEKDSVQTYSFQVLRRKQNHNIYFNVRNDQSYGYSNLWLFVTLTSPTGEAKCDTIQLVLAESSGKWLGKGFSGTYNNRLIYRRNVFFPEPGQYAVRIQHGMRPDILDGISAIGIRVEKVY
jgi:gliding motility-associated lipoprotein GldH